MADEQEKRREQARMQMEDAIMAMIEAGFSNDEIKTECNYALETVHE
jgi:DNA-binding transcriptional regulator YhcF (GntR family)